MYAHTYVYVFRDVETHHAKLELGTGWLPGCLDELRLGLFYDWPQVWRWGGGQDAGVSSDTNKRQLQLSVSLSVFLSVGSPSFLSGVRNFLCVCMHVHMYVNCVCICVPTPVSSCLRVVTFVYASISSSRLFCSVAYCFIVVVLVVFIILAASLLARSL